MSIPVYDSPTFLDQKDKYLLGLSLPQLMAVVAVGFTLFLFSLILPFGVLYRLLAVLVVTGLVSVLMFVRPAGLSIPAYVVASLMSLFRRPVYEERQRLLLEGSPDWVKVYNRKHSRKVSGLLMRGKEGVPDELSVQAATSELQAELDNRVTQGSVAAEQFIRDGVRTLLKG